MLLPAGSSVHAKDLIHGVKPVFNYACSVKQKAERHLFHSSLCSLSIYIVVCSGVLK